MRFSRLITENGTNKRTVKKPIRHIVMIRPEAGGVAYVGQSCATELRARGFTVTELIGSDRESPAREGLRQIWARRSLIRSADIVHVELGATALCTFWLAFWAGVLRGDLVTVSHDGPLLVGSPGSGVMVTGPGVRDAIAHKVFARFLDRPLRALLRRRTMVWVTLAHESATAPRNRLLAGGHGGARRRRTHGRPSPVAVRHRRVRRLYRSGQGTRSPGSRVREPRIVERSPAADRRRAKLR